MKIKRDIRKTWWWCSVKKARSQGFTQALSATTVFHLRLSLKCSLGSGGRCKLWLKQPSKLPKPLEMALFFGRNKRYSYCIIISNSYFHILLNSWENPLQSSLLFTMPRGCASPLQHYAIFDCFLRIIKNKTCYSFYLF